MQKRKSKKILKYFFLLLLVGSINNINLNDLKLHNIKNVNIIGLDIKDKLILLNKKFLELLIIDGELSQIGDNDSGRIFYFAFEVVG